MNNESFDLMHQNPQDGVIPSSQAITDNLKLEINYFANGLSSSLPAVLGTHCCDDDLRERYRI